MEAHRVVIRRVSHFLENRFTDGGEVVSLTRRPPFTPRQIPGTHFVTGWVDPRAIVRLEGLRGIEPATFRLRRGYTQAQKKVKLFLCCIKNNVMKTYRRVQLHEFLTSALDWGSTAYKKRRNCENGVIPGQTGAVVVAFPRTLSGERICALRSPVNLSIQVVGLYYLCGVVIQMGILYKACISCWKRSWSDWEDEWQAASDLRLNSGGNLSFFRRPPSLQGCVASSIMQLPSICVIVMFLSLCSPIIYVAWTGLVIPIVKYRILFFSLSLFLILLFFFLFFMSLFIFFSFYVFIFFLFP
jgi:hypothetical protein